MRKLQHILLLVLLSLAGCGGKEYTYVQENEMRPGPGILSGDEGGFVIYQSTDKPKQEKEEAVTPKIDSE